MKRLMFFSVFLCFAPTVLAYSCSDKIPYCKNMQSCEQAQFYLNQCGADRLDRDGDGIPCENICGKKGKSSKSGAEKSGESKSKKSKSSKSKK